MLRRNLAVGEVNRAVLYLRVSTDEQTTENQRPELVKIARTRKLRVVATYQETVSGAARVRPELARMLEDARRGNFDVVLVWSIDRLGRTMFGVLRDVLELEQRGVRVVSARESFLDVDGPARHLVLAVMSWAAEYERDRLIERTKAGMERARREGKQIGRPKRIGYLELQQIRRLEKQGKTQREIAMAVKIPRSTIRGVLGGKGQRPRSSSRSSRATAS